VFADESNAESLLLFTIRETSKIGLSPETGTLLLIVEKVDRDPDDSEICKLLPGFSTISLSILDCLAGYKIDERYVFLIPEVHDV